MRSSRLPAVKTLGDFDFTFQPSLKREQVDGLHSLGFVERRENVIFLGPPGVGKTHLPISLAIAAAQSGRRVYYGTLADIVASLEEASQAGSQQVKHLAANNYWMAALMLGGKPTPGMSKETGPDSVRTKAEIIEYLRRSFAALHKAVATIDQANVVEPTNTPSAWQKTRLSLAVDAVAHYFDHYGQLVEYLRMNGIVPPDSQPKKP